MAWLNHYQISLQLDVNKAGGIFMLLSLKNNELCFCVTNVLKSMKWILFGHFLLIKALEYAKGVTSIMYVRIYTILKSLNPKKKIKIKKESKRIFMLLSGHWGMSKNKIKNKAERILTLYDVESRLFYRNRQPKNHIGKRKGFGALCGNKKVSWMGGEAIYENGEFYEKGIKLPHESFCKTCVKKLQNQIKLGYVYQKGK